MSCLKLQVESPLLAHTKPPHRSEAGVAHPAKDRGGQFLAIGAYFFPENIAYAFCRVFEPYTVFCRTYRVHFNNFVVPK